MDELSTQIMACESKADLDKVAAELFNVTFKKGDMLKAIKLSELEDKIIKQAEDRINNHADEFSNQDLLNYMNLVNNQLEKIKAKQDPTIPVIAVQNNTLINLNNEQKDHIREYLKGIINRDDFTIDA